MFRSSTSVSLNFILGAMLFWNFTVTAFSQEDNINVNYSFYSIKDGLSSRFIVQNFQDSKGYLWIATMDGLNRFDGYRFQPFTEQEYGFQDKRIWRILEDNFQRLWIMYQVDNLSRKIDILDLNTYQVSSFDETFRGIDIMNDDIFVMEQKATGELILETIDGRSFLLEDSSTLRSIFSSSVQEEVHVYPTQGGGFLHFPTQSRKLKDVYIRREYQRNSEVLMEGVTKTITFDNRWQRWALVGCRAGQIQIYDFKLDRLIADQEPYGLRAFAQEICHDNAEFDIEYDPYFDCYWLYVNHRLWAINKEGERLIELTDDLEEKIRTGVNNLYIDRNHILWIATNAGVVSARFDRKKFTVYAQDETPVLAIRGITTIDQDHILFSSEMRSYQLNLKTGDKELLAGKCPAYVMHWNRDSTLLLFHYGFEQCNFQKSRKGNIFLTRELDQGFDESLYVYFLLDGKEGGYWAGTSRGLNFLDSLTATPRSFEQDHPLAALNTFRVQHATPAGTGSFWLATSGGLFLWESDSHRLSRYHSSLPPPHQLPFDDLSYVNVDAEHCDHLWLASKGGGLIRLEVSTGEYQQWTKRENLSDDFIYAVYEDDFQSLWLPSNYGLMQLNKQTGDVQTYLTEDGIADNEFNTNAHYQLPDGRLLFGGLNGLTMVTPQHFRRDTNTSSTAPFVFTDFYSFNAKQRKLINIGKQVLEDQQLTIRPQDLFARVEFALLDFSLANEKVYSYRIFPLEKEWVPLDQASLRIFSLPHGEYQLQVKGRNVTNGNSEQELMLPLKIIGHFYERRWFQISLLLIILSFLFIWVNKREKTGQRIRELLEEEVANQTVEITNSKRIIEAQASRIREIETTDDLWVGQLTELTLKHLAHPQMSIQFLAECMEESERQLYRKTKTILGKTPNAFIRELRLEQAKKLLETKTYTTVQETALAVGFQKASYFSKVFSARYGRKPSDYLRPEG